MIYDDVLIINTYGALFSFYLIISGVFSNIKLLAGVMQNRGMPILMRMTRMQLQVLTLVPAIVAVVQELQAIKDDAWLL